MSSNRASTGSTVAKPFPASRGCALGPRAERVGRGASLFRRRSCAAAWDELRQAQRGVDEGVDRDEGSEGLEPLRVEDIRGQ